MSKRGVPTRAATWTIAAISVAFATTSLCSTDAVYAAEITDVVDAFDELDGPDGRKKEDPFDIHIEPSFKRTLKRAKITREAPCNPLATETGPGPGSRETFPRLTAADRCAEPDIEFNKELRAFREINELNIDLQIGVFRDVELHVHLPIIFSDIRGYKYAGDGGDPTSDVVDPENSSVDPSDERIIADIQRNGDDFTTYRLFDVNGLTEGPTRSGFGDMSIGVAWNPFNNERDDTKATLKLGFDYLIPSGEIAKPGNEGVGRGVHELKWSIASSKRFKYMEPYFQVAYTLPVASSASLFEDFGGGQTLSEPGQRAELIFGAEFVPYEDVAKGNKFNIDIGLKFGYTAEGRDYNLLSDAFNESECNGVTPEQVADAIEAVNNGSRAANVVNTAACRWILDQPANAVNSGGSRTPVYDLTANSAQNVPFSHNGLADYESFATFGAYIGLYLQAANYVQFRAKVGLDHEQEHFMTSARTGRDSGDDNDTVRFDDPAERNPYFNPTLDAVGNRFRVEETTVFTWSIAMALQF